ncbi:MAG TPA: hypothetical protein VMS71_07020, partial [Candidatus Acidoferrum sp.]|nr:hypothetical protein [Candidatus Acidoferrum sp.]
FLIWLQLSWLIVLLGAEIAYAVQNVHTYEFEADIATISPANKRLISLLITHRIVHAFAAGEQPLTVPQLARQLGIPFRLASVIVSDLAAANLVSSTETERYKEPAWQPSSDIERYSIQYVIERLDATGGDAIPVRPSEELTALSQTLANFSAQINEAPSNLLLRDI